MEARQYLGRYAITLGATTLIGTVLTVEEIRAFINSLFVSNGWCDVADRICFGRFYVISFVVIFALALAVDALRNIGWFRAKYDYLTLHNRNAIDLYAEEDSVNLVLKNDEWRGPFINIQEVAVVEGRNRISYLFRSAGFHLKWKNFVKLPFLNIKGERFSLSDICGGEQGLRGYGGYQFRVSLLYSFKNLDGRLAHWDVDVQFTEEQEFKIDIRRAI